MISARQAKINSTVAASTYQKAEEALEIISNEISKRSNYGEISCVVAIDKSEITLNEAQLEKIKDVLKYNEYIVSISSTSDQYKFSINWSLDHSDN